MTTMPYALAQRISGEIFRRPWSCWISADAQMRDVSKLADPDFIDEHVCEVPIRLSSITEAKYAGGFKPARWKHT